MSARPEGFQPWSSITYQFCGDHCVYRTLPGNAIAIEHGHDGRRAVVSGQRVWLPFDDQPHPPGHPLHTPGKVDRTKLLGRIAASPPSGCVPVAAVCRCGYVIPLLFEDSIVPPVQKPAWVHRFVEPQIQHSLHLDSWPRFRAVVVSLAQGLQNLHARGVAHGDAYLFNAVWQPPGALWIDLGRTAPLTAESAALDAFVFLHFGVLQLVTDIACPPAGLKALRAACAAPLSASLELLSQLPEDDGPASKPEAETVLEMIELHLAANATSSAPRLSMRALYAYYRALRWSEHAAARFELRLTLEQARHQIAEREIHRVMRLENNREVQRLAKGLDQAQAVATERKAYLERVERDLHETRETVAHQRSYIQQVEQDLHLAREAINTQSSYITQLERDLHAARATANGRGVYIGELERDVDVLRQETAQKQVYIEQLEQKLHEARLTLNSSRPPTT